MPNRGEGLALQDFGLGGLVEFAEAQVEIEPLVEQQEVLVGSETGGQLEVLQQTSTFDLLLEPVELF